MANTYTVPGILLSGTHSGRPAASTVAKGTVYAETDTGAMFQSDGSSWNAWGSVAQLVPGAATSYTPALSAASGTAPVLGTGSSVEGHYIQIGKLVTCWGQVNWGSSGNTFGTGEYQVTLPVTAISIGTRVFGSALLYDSSATAFYTGWAYNISTTKFRFAVSVLGTLTANATQPFTWANSDAFVWQMTYEAA